MSNIAGAFKNGTAFVGFVAGGDPSVEKSGEFILAMAESGADIVEIGIPFSDPVAEGTAIQEANIRALRGGVTTEKLFALVERVRAETAVPLVFLSYLNPVFHYGYGAFFQRCASCGIDGIVIPDLPFEERDELRGSAEKYGVDLISLIAAAPEERIGAIAKTAAGFLYVVPPPGDAGADGKIVADPSAIVSTIRGVTEIPVVLGLDIPDPEGAVKTARAAIVADGIVADGIVADGIVAENALAHIVARHGDAAAPEIRRCVRSMKAALRGA